MIRGLMMRSCPTRNILHASISDFSGFLFSGGLQQTTLQMYTSCREKPMASIILFNSCPARPMKGRPSLSSLAPGPSPTKATGGLSIAPSPKTLLVRPCQRTHLWQMAAFSFNTWRAAAPPAPRRTSSENRLDWLTTTRLLTK